MNAIGTALIFGLLLAACDSEHGQDSNVQFTLSECAKGAGKPGAEKQAVPPGKLLFRSKDSLAFSFTMNLNCQAEYAMIASIASPETLDLVITDIGDSRARCFCAKDVGIEFASGGGLGKVGFVKVGSQIFELK